ncbi:hypothetical protein L291_2992 [Acinetobacter guillouiae MSP4-18]|nr:hypothetical protein L291_2992 [Acinetobacter guillouiae MSP4-18]
MNGKLFIPLMRWSRYDNKYYLVNLYSQNNNTFTLNSKSKNRY